MKIGYLRLVELVREYTVSVGTAVLFITDKKGLLFLSNGNRIYLIQVCCSTFICFDFCTLFQERSMYETRELTVLIL